MKQYDCTAQDLLKFYCISTLLHFKAFEIQSLNFVIISVFIYLQVCVHVYVRMCIDMCSLTTHIYTHTYIYMYTVLHIYNDK